MGFFPSPVSEHLPKYAPQSSESRSIRFASRGRKEGDGEKDVLANTEIKAAVFSFSLTAGEMRLDCPD